MTDVRTIVAEYLREHGFDGLCTDECGCNVRDLFPCESGDHNNPLDCVPGSKARDPDEPHLWVIQEDKPEVTDV